MKFQNFDKITEKLIQNLVQKKVKNVCNLNALDISQSLAEKILHKTQVRKLAIKDNIKNRSEKNPLIGAETSLRNFHHFFYCFLN